LPLHDDGSHDPPPPLFDDDPGGGVGPVLHSATFFVPAAQPIAGAGTLDAAALQSETGVPAHCTPSSQVHAPSGLMQQFQATPSDPGALLQYAVESQTRAGDPTEPGNRP
jgi:hypothetical protein